MGNRASVYMGEPLVRLLSVDENRSGRLNEIAARYNFVIERDRPKLSRNEWCAICDALNGYWMLEEASIRFAWAEVADCTGLGEKWGVDQGELAKRLRYASAGELIAVIETVQTFWNYSHLPTDEALEKAGV